MKRPGPGLAALVFLYIVWGSGFLAIRLAVSGTNAFAPVTLAGARTFAAGLLLLGFAAARGIPLRVSRPVFRRLVVTGLLLWVGGHTLILWAEQRLDSGLAALLFASSPLWAAALEGLRGRTVRALPLLLGFAGVSLVLPVGGAMDLSRWLDGGAMLLAALFWALGTVLDEGDEAPIAVAAGIQLTAAGLVNLGWALVAHEPWTQPGLRAWASFAYLTLFDTVLAFLAYAYARRRIPVGGLMSFAYVNPVVAVLLGAVVLGEKLNAREAVGMAVVLASVVWLLAPRSGEAA